MYLLCTQATNFKQIITPNLQFCSVEEGGCSGAKNVVEPYARIKYKESLLFVKDSLCYLIVNNTLKNVAELYNSNMLHITQ